MVVCYDCGKDLVLRIDVNSSAFVCKECGARYSFELNNKSIVIHGGNLTVDFFIPDLPLNIDLSKSLLYFLYDKGFVYYESVKEYNRVWFMDINLVRDKVRSFLQLRKDELKRKLNILQSFETKYCCSFCSSEFSDIDALNSNFNCPMCGHPLLLNNRCSSIDTINSEIVLIDKKLNSLYLM